MTVEHLNALRKTAREKGVYLHVLKNSLARRAVAGTPFEVASASMVGPLIYGFSQDAVAAAKVLSDFAKTNDKLVVKAGAHAGKALDAKGVESLASVPPKEVLLAQLLGLMQSPIARLARVCAAAAPLLPAPRLPAAASLSWAACAPASVAGSRVSPSSSPSFSLW